MVERQDVTPWQILTAVAGQLADITKANGYNTDIGLNSGAEPKQVDQNQPNVLVVTTQVDKVAGKAQRQRDFAGSIEAAVPADYSNAMQMANEIIDDIDKCMRKSTCAAPVGVTSIDIATATILNQPDGIASIIAAWSFTATYSAVDVS